MHSWIALFLAAAPPSPDMHHALHALATPTERFAVDGAIFHLHASDGIGRSRLAAGAERTLGVAATARNYNTVLKLRAMVDDAPG